MDRAEALAWFLWAKSDRDARDGRYLPVLTHLLDVAACAWEILDREPPHTLELLAEDYGLDVDTARRWVCALAGLHDLGKASPTFQALWELPERHWPPEGQRLVPVSEKKVAHGEVSQVLLASLLRKLNWSPAAADKVADAVGCHHGRRTPQPNFPSGERGTGDWETGQFTLFRKVVEALGLRSSPSIPDLSPAAFMRLSGLTSFADWVGSSFEVPAQVDPQPIQDPAAYFTAARVKARAKLDAIGWTPRKPLQDEVQPPAEMFSYISGFVPRALQTQLAQALEGLGAEPTLILVEAPMGEGKTEAGLHAATWLQTKVGHRGLYIALPTMATGNAMYTRFQDFLGHAAAGRGIVPDLQLMHGGALLNQAYQNRIRRTKNPPTDPAEQDEERLNVRAESWFSVRKRAGLSEYGVGTVDQALLGVLGVPHQFVRLWGLGNRVVILDEIHAYDTYTSRLIQALVTWLRALGSSVILMSATLPAASRRSLLAAWGASEDGEAPPYPRLTLAQSGAATTHHIPGSREQTPLTVRALGASVEEVAQKALSLAQEGGCVAVIVNTVQRAQDVFGAIRDLHAGNLRTVQKKGAKDDLCAVLFHARYPAHAREAHENAVLKYLGPQPYCDPLKGEGDYRPRRLILIATQVAEQSLDFDADVMITDLAPIDLLLQRAGRLHRHRANAGRRHAHTAPQLWVAGLNEWPTRALEEQRWKWVYAPALLYRSWLALQEGQSVRLPADLDTLVQRVYGNEVWYTLTAEQEQEVQAAEGEFRNKVKNEGTLGNLAHIGMPAHFFGHPPHIEAEPDGEAAHDDPDREWPQTRLGEESVRIVPVYRVDGTLSLDPAGKIKACLGGKSARPRAEESAKIYRHSLRVSKRIIVHFAGRRAEEQGLRFVSWAEDPLLRDTLPVLLDSDGCAEFPGLRVTLDAELGLVYEPGASGS